MTRANPVAAVPMSTKPRDLRADIQALRAIAVALVILDHLHLLQELPGGPQGGFLGVDIFFVVSGFLITNHLVSATVSGQRFSFVDFYIRRARRILPMAVLVILVTIAASYLIMWPWQAARTAEDGLWAAVFVSNVAFAVRGVDYFSAGRESIFQHYWSLSVEEQFYIGWPLIVAIAGVVALRTSRPRIVLLVASMVVGATSFAWACYATSASPTTAYFSTFARAFEFAIGGALAIAIPLLVKVPDAFRPFLSASGLAGIALSVFIIHPESGFPGPAGILPVAAAGLFIAAGTGTSRSVAPWPLQTRPVTYVGDISYSLYLWHWPVIGILWALVPRDIVVVPVALVLTLVLSAFSYRFIEQPVRLSAWLLAGKQRRFSNRHVSKNLLAMGMLLVLVTCLVAALDATVRKVSAGRAESGAVAVGHFVIQENQPPGARVLVEQLGGLINVGLRAESWANLRPSIAEIGTYDGALTTDCWTRADEAPRSCLRGDPQAAHTIAVFGDSIAMNAAFAVDAFVEKNPDWNLRVYAKLGCAATAIPAAAPGGGPYPECRDFRDWAVEEIRALQPDAIWMTSALPRSIPGIAPSDVVSAWDQGLRTTLKRLNAGSSVFVVMPPPAGEDLAFCSRPRNTPQDCGSRVTQRFVDVAEVSAEASRNLGARFVDTTRWFCDEAGRCPAVIGDHVVRRDERHLTYDFGAFLAPLVEAWVSPPGGPFGDRT